MKPRWPASSNTSFGNVALSVWGEILLCKLRGGILERDLVVGQVEMHHGLRTSMAFYELFWGRTNVALLNAVLLLCCFPDSE